MMMLMILAVLIALICLNVPIAVSLAVAGVIGLLVNEGTSSLVTVAFDMYDGATKFSLIAIPMFVLAGAIMNAGGVTDRLIAFVAALFRARKAALFAEPVQERPGRGFIVYGHVVAIEAKGYLHVGSNAAVPGWLQAVALDAA